MIKATVTTDIIGTLAKITSQVAADADADVQPEIQVFHNRLLFHPTPGIGRALNDLLGRDQIPALCSSDLKLVASVATDSLDEAYFKTQHIHSDWQSNPGVTVIAQGKLRSTSMGDVLRHQGKFYLVARIGFTQIEIEQD